jgi:hypothetical protein
LVSQVLWVNALQYIGEEGIRLDELHGRARTDRDGLTGLKRWGCVVVTEPGRNAQVVWWPLAGEIEDGWRSRFGTETTEALRHSLGAVRDQFEIALPRYLPVVFPTQNGKAAIWEQGVGAPWPDPPDRLDLSVLLSQVLLHFALDYESEAKISLTIAANTLCVLDDVGVAERDLPGLTGVSKEANAMALGFWPGATAS